VSTPVVQTVTGARLSVQLSTPQPGAGGDGPHYGTGFVLIDSAAHAVRRLASSPSRLLRSPPAGSAEMRRHSRSTSSAAVAFRNPLLRLSWPQHRPTRC